jgi:hypothetical protein
MPSQAAPAMVRFAEGAPVLETLYGGVLQVLGTAYLQVDGKTVASSFEYGTFTPFLPITAGVHSLTARDTDGYAVGPLTTSALTAGGRYTLILVGTYPKYSVLTFAEPASSGAQLSLYEASPTVPQATFGSFRASSHSDFKQLSSASLGSVVTVALGKRVSDFGGYAAAASGRIGTLTPKQLDAFDAHNVLPFHAAGRLSLFLFDRKSGTPLFGSLDP